jgi:hypothetical protein
MLGANAIEEVAGEAGRGSVAVARGVTELHAVVGQDDVDLVGLKS